jgi:hypothetical protein
MRGTRYITGTITGATAGPASSTGVPTWTVTSAGLVSVLVEDGRILHFTSLVKGGGAAARQASPAGA